ncbi:MAG: alpha/beta hydrolase, partial [Phycisphaerales bacterium]|nr:alpha/beta hydrolase [Phycisphaerales bacterium]
MTAILYLHGGGHADHTRYAALIERFDALGIIGHAFDHHAITLAGRLDEAEQELSKLKSQHGLSDSDIYVWGSSMGGHIAARLTATHPNFAGLILQSAAAYSKAAENIPFGPAFTTELHKEGNWQD